MQTPVLAILLKGEKMQDFWRVFLTSNETKYRLARTILQEVIGVIAAYLDVIVGMAPIPNELRPLIVAIVMAILSPIMSELGASIEANDRTAAIQYTNYEDTPERMEGDVDDDGSEA